MKREGDIRILEVIEQRIVANGHHKLLRSSGNDGEYHSIGEDSQSALFIRR